MTKNGRPTTFLILVSILTAIAGLSACESGSLDATDVFAPALAKGGNGGGGGPGGGGGGGPKGEPSAVVGFVVPSTTSAGSVNALQGDGLDYDAATPRAGETRYEDGTCDVAVIQEFAGGVTSYAIFLNEGRGKKACARTATFTFPDGSPLGTERTNDWKVNWATTAADEVGETTVGWGKISLPDARTTCDPFRFNPGLAGFEGTDSFRVRRVSGGWRISALAPGNLGACETESGTVGSAYAVDVEWTIDEDVSDGVEP